MEKVRLIAFSLTAFRWYLVAAHFAFAVFVAFLVALTFEDEAIREYCIEVPAGNSYDFTWHDGVFCKIDWRFFLIPFLAQVVFLYGLFIAPAWILWLFLRRARKMVTKAGS